MRKLKRIPKWRLTMLVIVDAVYSFAIYLHENIGFLPFDDYTNFYIKIAVGVVMTIGNLILLAHGKKRNDQIK